MESLSITKYFYHSTKREKKRKRGQNDRTLGLRKSVLDWFQWLSFVQMHHVSQCSHDSTHFYPRGFIFRNVIFSDFLQATDWPACPQRYAHAISWFWGIDFKQITCSTVFNCILCIISILKSTNLTKNLHKKWIDEFHVNCFLTWFPDSLFYTLCTALCITLTHLSLILCSVEHRSLSGLVTWN